MLFEVGILNNARYFEYRNGLCLQTQSIRYPQLVKNLVSEKQDRATTIQDKSGKCLTEETRESQLVDRILLRAFQP